MVNPGNIKVAIASYVEAPKKGQRRKLDVVTGRGGTAPRFSDPALTENTMQILHKHGFDIAENDPYPTLPGMNTDTYLQQYRGLALDIPKDYLTAAKAEEPDFNLIRPQLVTEKIDALAQAIAEAALKTLPAPSFTRSEYKKALDTYSEYSDPKRNPEGKSKTIELFGTITDGEVDDPPFLDHVITVDGKTTIEVYASQYPQWTDRRAKSPERIYKYYINIANGVAQKGLAIFTKNRDLARAIHDDVAAQYKKHKAVRPVINWLCHQSAYSRMKSELNPELPLLGL